MDFQFVLRVIATLFIFLIITKVIMIITERIGKEFGFGDMIINFGSKVRHFLNDKKYFGATLLIFYLP